MPSPVDARVAHIVTSYSDTVREVRTRVTSFVERLWGGLESFRDTDIDRFVARVVPVVAGGQRQVASLTDSYLAAVETSVLGKAVPPTGVPASVIASESLRGLPARTIYQRPGLVVWGALSKGQDIETAARAGLDRALSLATTDLQLARTHTSRYLMSNNPRITGYRRVPGGANVCDLCALASENHYSRGDLMPIHPGCSCDVEPDFASTDLPDTVDVQPQIEETDIGFTVHEHGELGPVLAVAGQAFTGPDDI